MMRRFTQGKWVIVTIILLTIVGITLVSVPWNHATNAKAATNSQTQHCDDHKSTSTSPQGFFYYQCQSIGLGSECLRVHSIPSTDPATFIDACVTSYPNDDGYFDVICQTQGDEVAGISNLWDALVPRTGAHTAAFVSDYYIATENMASPSTNIPNCSQMEFGLAVPPRTYS